MRTSVLLSALLTASTIAILSNAVSATEKNITNQVSYPKVAGDFYFHLKSSSPAGPKPDKAAIDKLLQSSKTVPTAQILVRIQQLKQCIEQYKAIGDEAGLRSARVQEAMIAYRQSDYRDADRLLKTVELKLERNSADYWSAKSLRGLLKLESGDLHGALPELLSTRSQPFNGFINEQLNTTGMAEAYYRLGQYRVSADLALLSSRNGADSVSRAQAFQILGDINFDLGKPEDAIDYYQKAAKLSASIGAGGGLRNYNSTTTSLIQLGRVYQTLNRTAESRAHLIEAVTLSKQQFNNHKTVVMALNAAAMLNLETKNLPEALEQLTEAQNWVRGADDPTVRIITLGNFGHYYAAIGDFDRATRSYTDAINQAKRMGDRASEAKLRSAYGQLLLKKKQLKPAIESLEKSITLFESLRPRLIDSERIAIAEQQAKTYQLLQSAQVQSGNTQAALLTTERSRARAFVELLATRSPLKSSSRSIDSDNSANDNTSIKASIDTTISTTIPTLDQIKLIAKSQNATIVTYAIVNQIDNNSRESELHTWIIQTHGEIQFKKTDLTSQNRPSSDSLESIANNTLRQISSRSRNTRASIKIEGVTSASTERNANRAAHELLIEPIKHWLPKNDRDRIIFVPQGSLLLVPFAALQDKNGTFLIQRHTLQIAPSIQSLSLLKPIQNLQPNPLIVGNPSPMPQDFDPLPGSETEATAIAALLHTTAITGKNATKRNILTRLSSASLIHLATHGILDERQGLESAIVLASSNRASRPDELLTASEILDLNLTASLVVLSACNTGRGKITGDGVIGLSRSFLSAGVPSVVVSLWQVPDAPTSTLMIAFYQNLIQKMDKAQALRQAMLTTLKVYPNPQDWAGFMLVGRSD